MHKAKDYIRYSDTVINMKNIKHQFGLNFLFLIIVFSGFTNAQIKPMNAKVDKTEDQTLSVQEKSIVTISALTAKGDLEKLKKALNNGLDAGLTINEIKEVFVQMYAYSGFPRSLNGINTFMAVLEDRKAKGIKDTEGKSATPIPDSDKYERGRKTLEKLTGQTQPKPAKGYGEFSPRIDRFLKEHLFADIFDSDVLTYRQREIATISALAAMPGVEPQLQSHLKVGMNVGLTEPQLNDLFDAVENSVGKTEVARGRKVLNEVLKKSNDMENTENKDDRTIFGKGEKVTNNNFTGTVYVQMLVPKNDNIEYSIGNVTFEPGARSNWHTHPAGQNLLVTDGIGLYQEKGKPVKTIKKGDVIVCDANIEHWHGASPGIGMSHIAITNFKDGKNVGWLKPVTDEEYNAE
jgi:4-carboxymuconolactone decarboxylase